jgi:hypothetical protein
MQLMNVNDPTVKLTANGTTANIEMPGSQNGEYVIFTNVNTFAFYVKLGGDNTVTATVNDTIIPTMSQVSYKKRKEQDWCAAITDGSEGVLRIQYGNGA